MLEALITFRLVDTDESCWNVGPMVGLRAEACTDLIFRFHEYADLVNSRVQLPGGQL